jgi:ribosomal-protein-alanine N-acetyltransferase
VTVTLRRARRTDVDAIAAIERAAFSDPWSPASFEAMVKAPRVSMTVAVEGDEVVGYNVVLLAAPDADLANFAVKPSARRRGIGRQLLADALSVARAAGVKHVFLEVRESNAAAIALYESAGFTSFSRRRRYYTDPVEDARVLRLEL